MSKATGERVMRLAVYMMVVLLVGVLVALAASHNSTASKSGTTVIVEPGPTTTYIPAHSVRIMKIDQGINWCAQRHLVPIQMVRKDGTVVCRNKVVAKP